MPLYTLSNTRNNKTFLFSTRRWTGIVIFLLSVLNSFIIFTNYLPGLKHLLLGLFGLFNFAILFAMVVIGGALIGEKRIVNDNYYVFWLSLALFGTICIFSMAFNGVNIDLTFGEYLSRLYTLQMSVSGISTGFIIYPIVYFIGDVGAYVLFLILIILGAGFSVDYHSKTHTRTVTRYSNAFYDKKMIKENEYQQLNPIFTSNQEKQKQEKVKVAPIKTNSQNTTKEKFSKKNLIGFDDEIEDKSEKKYVGIFDSFYEKNSSSDITENRIQTETPLFDVNYFDSSSYSEEGKKIKNDKARDMNFLKETFGEKKEENHLESPVNIVQNNISQTQNSETERKKANYRNINFEENKKIIESVNVEDMLLDVDKHTLNIESSVKKEDIDNFTERNKLINEEPQGIDDELIDDDNLQKENDSEIEEEIVTKKSNPVQKRIDPNESERTISQGIEDGIYSSKINPEDKNKGVNFDFRTNKLMEKIEEKSTQNFKRRPYNRPPLSLLSDLEVKEGQTKAECLEISEKIENTLKSFNIQSKVVQFIMGPAVTRYLLEIQQGIQLNRIQSYASDLKAATECVGNVIIHTPLSGTKYVGVDIPNKKTTTVPLKDMISTLEFMNSEYNDLFVIGKTITGKDVYARLEKLPHLLVAGTTGSGKSVFLNSILLSLIYHASPEDLRFLIIDPKFVEFGPYNGIPHLLTEKVITDTNKAIRAFEWAVEEMDNRYILMAEHGVTNIKEYNELEEVKNGTLPKKPKIMILVDEFADLIMKCRKELEDKIERIGQKSRAAGIYLILATQRPTTDIVTGNLKANLPSRVSLKVENSIDSRTIIGRNGAEGLIGNGDMLYKSNTNPELERIQGTYYLSSDIKAVVKYIKENNDCFFDEEIENTINKVGGEVNAKSSKKSPDENDLNTMSDDEIIIEALRLFLTGTKISKSILQRKFMLGFNRAARIFDNMIEEGYIAVENNKYVITLTEDDFIARFGEDF